ncbi:MAG: nuclear transport factor 2 family protein [Pseudomonadota bacterium]
MDHTTQDILAITEVIQQIARAYDLKRHRELLPQVMEPDARQKYYILGQFVDMSMPEGMETLLTYHDVCYACQHLVAPPAVELNGDLAKTTSPVHAVHVQIRDDGSRNNWILGAYYHDTIVRRGSTWRLQERTCMVTYESGEFLTSGVRRYPTLPDYTQNP